MIIGLDADLKRLVAAHIGSRNFWEIKELVLNSPSGLVEIGFTQLTRDRNRENFTVVGHVRDMDLWALGFTREGVDGIDSRFDFIAKLPKVHSFFRFDVDVCRSASGL